ncbi:MFS-type transporter SLC18B1-like protein, partial [Leptotrombidium deliense]
MNAVTGKLLPLVGSKIALSVGIIFVGFCNILFGLLEYIEHYETFVFLCFIVRIIEGIGAALINTTSYLILI